MLGSMLSECAQGREGAMQLWLAVVHDRCPLAAIAGLIPALQARPIRRLQQAHRLQAASHASYASSDSDGALDIPAIPPGASSGSGGDGGSSGRSNVTPSDSLPLLPLLLLLLLELACILRGQGKRAGGTKVKAEARARREAIELVQHWLHDREDGADGILCPRPCPPCPSPACSG